MFRCGVGSSDDRRDDKTPHALEKTVMRTGLAAKHLNFAIVADQNDYQALQRARYMMLNHRLVES
jgi:hypothetical protein